MRSFFLPLLFLTSAFRGTLQDGSSVLCFDVHGAEYKGMMRCPGQAFCCQSADQCTFGGLCSTTQPSLFYRAACIHDDWRGCNRLCHYQEENQLPFVRKCSDSSYCCDRDGTLGQQCCDNHQGTVLDDRGRISVHLSATGSSTISLPTSAWPTGLAPTPVATADVTAAAADGDAVETIPIATPTASPTPSPGLSVGVVAGISLASTIVGLAALTALVFWICRRKRISSQPEKGAPPDFDDDHLKELYAKSSAKRCPSSHELETDALPEYELSSSIAQALAPHELDALRSVALVYELDSSSGRRSEHKSTALPGWRISRAA